MLISLVSLTTHAIPEKTMFKMDYEVQIGAYKLKGIESVTVESSADLLADQCKIMIPSMAYNKAYDVEKKIKRGDVVTVKLGYDSNLHTEFKGYLKAIHPNAPMKLECEDSIYLFRKEIKDKQFKKTNAVAILQYVIDQINPQLTGTKMKLVTDLSGLQFDTFTIVRANGYEVLEKLKSETGLAIYCRDNELHCHLLYTKKRGDVTYNFTKNLEDSDDLEYVRAQDVKVLVKVVGRTKKGATVEVEVGEKGGDVRTFQKPTISDKATLETVGREELKKLSFDGYKGAVKGWLLPVCEFGYSARLIDVDYPEREGRYYVNAVKTEFSSSGGRRTVTLGVKVSV
ncbi:hypothetical protein GCM10027190_39660 [Spirosoma areae]